MTGATDPRLSFGPTAEIYDQIRPTYPPALYDDLFDEPALKSGSEPPLVIEVGPGTGKATRDLLGRGARVHGIEISPAMAAKLRTGLQSEDLTITVGDFEAMPVDTASADVVFSATAYHWVSPKAQANRPAELLRPGGLIAIVDLIQVDSDDDHGFFTAAQPIYERYGQGHKGPPAPKRHAVDPPMAAVLADDDRYTDTTVRCYDWNQTYSAPDYRKLMLSYSGTQMMGDTARRGLLDEIETFINDEFGGVVTRPLVTTLTTSSLRT
ncbi:MAG: class I SAM-dependent methyltransferase [Acidimicrobiales bacterium]